MDSFETEAGGTLSLPQLILARPYLSALIACLLTTWTTQIWSNVNFMRTRHKGQPPIVPYAIPILHHAISLTIRGSSKFFTSVMNKYGNRTPFLVMAGPLKFAVIADPKHIRKVFHSKDMSTKMLCVRLFRDIFRSPQKALDFYAADQSQFLEEQRIDYAHTSIPRKFLAGTHLISLSDRYLATLRRNLMAGQFKEGNWMEIQDLHSFLQGLLTRTSTATLFGTSILELYPRLATDFWVFYRKRENFTPTQLRFMASDAYAARDRLLDKFKEWDGVLLNSKDMLEDEAEWNACGSKYVRVRQRAFLKMEGMDSEARASEALGLLQGLNVNLFPSTFWTVFEVLRDPKLKRRVLKEFKSHLTQHSGPFDITKLATIPLLQSLYAEVLRLRIASATARTAEERDVELDEQYFLEKGTTAMIFSRPLALNQGLWEKARPDAVARPLNEFWAERFLTRDGTFSMEGISSCWVPFGAGQHLCPGRHFAKHMAISTLALLLGEHEVEPVDPERIDEAVPEEIGLAFGIINPKHEVPVRIRKRKI